MTLTCDNWSLVVAVTDAHVPVLRSTLLRSPDIDLRCHLVMKHGYSSAAAAYNEAIAETKSEIIVFAHADVYLPGGWLDSLARTVDSLAFVDPNWAVLGVAGVTRMGTFAGHLYSTGLKRVLGEPFDDFVETTSLDEVLLITRRAAGLRFDERVGFHFYGTDICLEGKRRRMKSYIMSAFCIHNSNGIRTLPFAFWRSYWYMRRKWSSELPIHTCCTTITRRCWPAVLGLWSRVRGVAFASTPGKRCGDPEALYHALFPVNKG